MGITQRDVMMLFTMGLAVVSMSFVFPALGLGGENIQENEIPELSISENRFDFAGTAPSPPDGASRGQLSWYDNRSDQLNQVYPDGDTQNGIEVGLLPPNSNRPLQISNARWESGSLAGQEKINLSSGETAIYSNETLGLEATFEVTHYNDTDPREFVVQYKIRSVEDVGGSGWTFGIGLGDTAAGVGWLADIIIWFALFMVDVMLNAIVVAGEVGFYFVNLLTWLTTTYTSIVAAANSWASVFVALPGILLSVVLGKFVIVGISLLPTT